MVIFHFTTIKTFRIRNKFFRPTSFIHISSILSFSICSKIRKTGEQIDTQIDGHLTAVRRCNNSTISSRYKESTQSAHLHVTRGARRAINALFNYVTITLPSINFRNITSNNRVRLLDIISSIANV